MRTLRSMCSVFQDHLKLLFFFFNVVPRVANGDQREKHVGKVNEKNLFHAVEAASRSRSLCSEVGDSPEFSLEGLMIDDGVSSSKNIPTRCTTSFAGQPL